MVRGVPLRFLFYFVFIDKLCFPFPGCLRVLSPWETKGIPDGRHAQDGTLVGTYMPSGSGWYVVRSVALVGALLRHEHRVLKLGQCYKLPGPPPIM